MDEFLANQDISENSRRKYRDNMHVFIGWMTRNADVRYPKRSDIIQYKQWLIKSGRSALTIDNYLAPVRQFFRYLEDIGEYDNIAAGVHSPRKYLGYRKDYLRPDQVTRLLATINRLSIQGLRDYAVVNLMVRTGMRCIEVTRIDLKDLTIENKGWIIYIQGKGHLEKDRALGLSLKVINPIREYINALDSTRESDPLFRNHSYVSNNTRLSPVTISKFIKRYLRSIGIDSPRITAHSLRHTAAITALKNGATIFEVSRMLGHRSIETTQIYLRAIEEEMSRNGTAVRRLDNAFKTGKKNNKIKEIYIPK